MTLVVFLVVAVCLAVIVVLYWSHHADLHHPENGLEARVAWLIDQNGRLRTALRGAGIAVEGDEEPAGSGRHAAKPAESPQDRSGGYGDTIPGVPIAPRGAQGDGGAVLDGSTREEVA